MNQFSQAWICPRCKRVNAPFMPTCFCSEESVTTNNVGTEQFLLRDSPIEKQRIKIKNILAFVVILFHDNAEAIHHILKHAPQYIVEKFDRYVMSDNIEYEWGIHKSLKETLFDNYVEKWKLELGE